VDARRGRRGCCFGHCVRRFGTPVAQHLEPKTCPLVGCHVLHSKRNSRAEAIARGSLNDHTIRRMSDPPRGESSRCIARGPCLYRGSTSLSLTPFSTNDRNADIGRLLPKPALKLLEIFRSMARNEVELSQTQGSESVTEMGGAADFSTSEAQRVSNTVSRMRPVGEHEARTWIQYWISKGLF